MKLEALVFAGVAVFFGIVATGYATNHLEPVGTVALTVSCLMAALISAFCWRQHLKRGTRLQDRKDARVQEGVGHLDFFPPKSYAPVITALGAAVLATGVVYGVWLACIGVGVLAPGVAAFAFEFTHRSA
ncbi:cytochrome c oxidase subunit 4 [Streptomyces sp. JJ36]|uniref:aa3-type cytochrome oxidase subunit IV n=1 Tax=Streptomyces sp. JJ36 TaxID=2736645 RepID=UPI001F0096FC|nr:cytochrome c oxidase subunit 4 [Streptomyces sp. JJ36]MCF6522671.1 cytochrome c oxidase subunit 4 [Streptomyces sp. JJ36]